MPLPEPQKAEHSIFEDIQALLFGSLFVAMAVVLFRQAGLFTGGTAGLAFLIHYLGGFPFGFVFFVVNLPFYVFAVRALGWTFTSKTFVAVVLLSVYSEWLPSLIHIGEINPYFAAVMGGLLAGTGLLMLIRHRASLGGLGVLALYLQQTRGWRAGTVQMAADCVIVGLSIFIVPPMAVMISVLGAVAVNLVIAVNHRPGRYTGM
ncbi:MAG: YitT family protein [Rhodocyclaceae bacterium]|nr:YitT family protein [Rhodocyclaceae bacterium]MCP5232696.1 YitT family protein [Zoogloeaceae bacterium]MCP5238834.1 YitT family protein [Zoogloeaceae bacterium]MCP5254279.1 YitT family protein [Zoogloeaceae bacterium]MCW5614187.1 YitT family protein [Rhodocyclaceae bacterium]